MAYRLEIKHRNTPPDPFRWEIYDDGKPLWVERSAKFYRSRTEAESDGMEALERLENRKSLGSGEGAK